MFGVTAAVSFQLPCPPKPGSAAPENQLAPPRPCRLRTQPMSPGPIPRSPRAPQRASSANSPYGRLRSGGEAAQAPQPAGRAQSGVERQIGFGDGHAAAAEFEGASQAARSATRVVAAQAAAAEPLRRAAPRAQPQMVAASAAAAAAPAAATARRAAAAAAATAVAAPVGMASGRRPRGPRRERFANKFS